ncbi:MAG: helix-turn-helix domain-containing protein [Gemmatimonadales bacterium]
MSTIMGETTDIEILREVGRRLRAYRLQQNISVADVAARAGVSPNTVVNVEAGRNARLLTLVRLLRVYGRLEAINAFLPPPQISPLQLVRERGRTRQRARTRKDG